MKIFIGHDDLPDLYFSLFLKIFPFLIANSFYIISSFKNNRLKTTWTVSSSLTIFSFKWFGYYGFYFQWRCILLNHISCRFPRVVRFYLFWWFLYIYIYFFFGGEGRKSEFLTLRSLCFFTLHLNKTTVTNTTEYWTCFYCEICAQYKHAIRIQIF